MKRARPNVSCRILRVVATAVLALALAPGNAKATDLYRTNAAGTWADGLWTDSGLTQYGQPTGSDSAYIGSDQATPSAALVATVTVTSAGATVSNLYVGRSLDTINSGEDGTLILNDNTSLTVTNLHFGYNRRYGKGHLVLGANAAIDCRNNLVVNNSSVTFNGDQVSVGNAFYLGQAYNMYLTAQVVLDGGTFDVGGDVLFCEEIRQTGILVLTNSAVLNVGADLEFSRYDIGSNQRTYELRMAAGTAINITNDFILWSDDLSFQAEVILVGGSVRIGGRSGGTDTYTRFTQMGGQTVAGGLVVQDIYFRNTLSQLTLVSNAVLSLRRPTSGDVENIVGKSRSDRANRSYCFLGDANSPGTIDIEETGGSGTHSLTIYRPETAVNQNSEDMALWGWGKVALDGTLENNGKVIADGYGSNHDLVITNFSAVTQDEAHNSHVAYGFQFGDGSKPGWYAYNGGRLLLPPLTIGAGTSTNRWGDTIDDLTLTTNDLVNSLLVACSNVTGGDVSIALMATNHTESLVLYPDAVLGVWQADGSGFDFGSGKATLSFRYDHVLAQARGLTEADLKVWTQRYGGWVDVTATVDTTEKVIVTEPLRRFDLFAVSTTLPGDAPPQGTAIVVQ